MVDTSSLSGHQKAKIAEAAVLFRLCLHGFNPYGSFSEGEKPDWLVLDTMTGRVHRIEVRWTRMNRYGAPVILLRCSNGRGKCRRLRSNEFDFLVGYDLFTDMAYVYAARELEHLTTSVSVSPDALERWDKLRLS
jgi:hypothetical protein